MDQKIVLQQVGMILCRQMTIRAEVVQPLINFLQTNIIREVGCMCTIRLYGSLQHGLYVDGYSKICLDITCMTDEHLVRDHILQILASLL